MRRAALALLSFALLAPCGTGAQELQRLFFTPAERAALDARRKARLPDKPAAAVAASPRTRIDGYVARSSGKSTLWLDGYAVRDGNQPEGLNMSVRRGSDPSRVTVLVGEERRRVEMRVGETLDRGSGEVKGVIGKGDIRIKRGGGDAR
jgi:hypothetical protein